MLFRALLLLLIAFPAFADHHRAHAVMHLDDTLRFLDVSLGMAATERDTSGELAAFHLNKYVIYAGKYRDRIAAARELLVTGGNIEDVRRLVSAPGMGLELESADYGLAATFGLLGAAVRDGADASRVSLMMARHSKAAQSFGWAHWHVIDAIREEVYQDPAFVCAGPDNHCE